MEAIKGAAPPHPAQRACLAPQPRESCSQHHPESSRQTGKTHPPSGLGFVGVFPLGYFYLLDKKVESTVLFVSSSNTTQVNPERRVFNDLCLVTRCNVEGSPFSWKLTAKPPWEISVLIFFISSRIIPHESPNACANQHMLSDLTEESNYDKINLKLNSEGKKKLRHFQRNLNSDVKCKNSNSCLADQLSLLQGQEKGMRVN